MDEKTCKKMQKNQSKYFCELCNFVSSNKYNFDKHVRTNKHKMMKNPEMMNLDNECICGKTFLNKFNLTRHKKMCKENQSCFSNSTEIIEDDTSGENTMVQNGAKWCKTVPAELFSCSCGKAYQYRRSLNRHKKNCSHDEENTKTKTVEAVSDDIILEKITGIVHDKLEEFSSKLGNTITTNNITNNNTFNVNVFLHETCKEAITIGEMVKLLQNSVTDAMMCKSVQIGLMQNVEDQITDYLLETEETKRPIHVIDKKTHVKVASDEWTNKNTKQLLKNTIEEVGDGYGNFIFDKQTAFLNSIEGIRNPTYKEDEIYVKHSSANTVTLQDHPTKINKVVRNIEELVKIEK